MVKKRFLKTKGEYEVTFELAADGAENVELVCNVNGWEPIEMKRAKTGPFRAKLRLPKDGRFEFRYLVDHQSWVNDETADDYCTNRFGGQNGILDTTSPAS
jgi:1,4-alpha-glucan branching enzyme